MAEQVENVLRAEHRTRSELVREALRTYISVRRFPEETPSPSELRAIRRGQAAYRGEITSLSMNTCMPWTVILAGPAEKSLRRIPASDRERIHAA